MENSTIQSTQILPQLLHQLQQINTLMAHMQTQLNNTNKNGGNDSNNWGGNKSNKIQFWWKLYCWTNGSWNCQGGFCRAKAEGHKYNATFNKQLNKINRNCHHCDQNNNIWRCGTDSEVVDKDKNKSSYLPITLSSVVLPIMNTILAKSDSGESQNSF